MSYKGAYSILAAIAALLFTFVFASSSEALTSGAAYTVTVDRINSDGSTTSLGLSASATADSDGKISFTMAGIPDNSSCNFLVLKVKDSTGTVARKSIVPCPDSGGTLPAGISNITENQTDALLASFAAAGTDDPILAVFGFAIVRSEGITASELVFMATLANQGINGTGGYVDYLTSNGVTTTQLAAYRSNIVSRLSDASSGYSKLLKDSVDAATTAAELDKRGEAAALLLNILVKAATTAGFPQDRVIEAFNAMGGIVVPLMNQGVTNGDLTSATAQMINSSIGGGITKLRAEKGIEKYSNALSVLGASSADLLIYQNAATTLSNTMITAFRTFEAVFTGSETQTDIQNAQNVLDTTMQNAFNTFMTATAASNARITTMIASIDSALGSSSGLTASDFKFYKSNGTSVNWPITMVIPTDWVSSILSAGGSLSYSRDNTTIPAAMTWLGTCSASGFFDSSSCQSNGGTWTAGRTDFVGNGVPASYATVLGIQEDVMILEFARWNAQSSAGSDMSAQMALEKSFATSMAGLASNVSGTTDGTTSITSAQKTALVTLMQSPQF